MKPTKQQLIEKYGEEAVRDWDEDVVVDKLYEEHEMIKETKRYAIDFDPNSNLPFMVYKEEDGDFTAYSGEATLKKAKEVARRL